MKRWMKVAAASLGGLLVVAGSLVVVQRRALATGRRELQQHGASGFAKALSSLKIADRLGNAEAAYEIGKCYLDGKVTKVDVKAAMPWMQKAAGHGHPEAMAIVGQAMLEGDELPKDLIAGAQYLRRSAEAGSPLGMFQFGRALNNGQGVTQDTQLGNSWIDRAAEAGNVNAAFSQGGIYLLSSTNAKKGIHFLEIAANSGHNAATMLLFNAYIGSLGGPPDPGKALALIRKRTEEGDAWAIFKLSLAYGRPELGLQQDLKEAERLVRLAAEKGSLEARKIVSAMDAPKEDPIELVGFQVDVSQGGYAKIIGMVRNKGSVYLDAQVQFDLVSPQGVTLDTYQRTFLGLSPGGDQQFEINVSPDYRGAHVRVRDVRWR